MGGWAGGAACRGPTRRAPSPPSGPPTPPPHPSPPPLSKAPPPAGASTLGTGDATAASRPPPGACVDDWVARHAVDFLDAACLLHARQETRECGWGGGGRRASGARPHALARPPRRRRLTPSLPPPKPLFSSLTCQYCTPATCPAMTAGPRHEYLWPPAPGARGRPKRLAAPEYVSALAAWADGLVSRGRGQRGLVVGWWRLGCWEGGGGALAAPGP